MYPPTVACSPHPHATVAVACPPACLRLPGWRCWEGCQQQQSLSLTVWCGRQREQQQRGQIVEQKPGRLQRGNQRQPVGTKWKVQLCHWAPQSSATNRFLRWPVNRRAKIWLYALVWVRYRMYCRQVGGTGSTGGTMRGRRMPELAARPRRRRGHGGMHLYGPGRRHKQDAAISERWAELPMRASDLATPSLAWLEPTPSPSSDLDASGTWRMRGTKNSATVCGSSARQLTKNLRAARAGRRGPGGARRGAAASAAGGHAVGGRAAGGARELEGERARRALPCQQRAGPSGATRPAA